MSAPEDIVCRLLAIIAAQERLINAQDLLSEDVAIFMDDKLITQGRSGWFRWVSFLQQYALKTMSSLTISIDAIEVLDNDDLQVTARWQSTHKGKQQTSAPGQVVYSIHNGKITRIKTHRSNYTFIYGERIAHSRIAFYFLLFKIYCFTRASPNG